MPKSKKHIDASYKDTSGRFSISATKTPTPKKKMITGKMLVTENGSAGRFKTHK